MGRAILTQRDHCIYAVQPGIGGRSNESLQMMHTVISHEEPPFVIDLIEATGRACFDFYRDVEGASRRYCIRPIGERLAACRVFVATLSPPCHHFVDTLLIRCWVASVDVYYTEGRPKMLHTKRWLWVGFVVVFALLLTSGVAATQETDLAEAVRVAQSFDAKYLLPDYIGYTGIKAIAQHALAVHDAASFDAKFFDTDYIAYSGMQEIARRALAVHRVGVLDQILREQELAQEQFGDALATEAELLDRLANTECFDVKFTLEGSIYCNDQAQIVEEVVEEVDPS